MPRQLREYNLGHEGTLKQISEVLDANADLYSHIEVKCVAAHVNGKWRNALCVIRGIPKGSENQSAAALPQYPMLRFYGKRIRPADLQAFLQTIRANQLELDGLQIEAGQNCALNSFEFKPAENEYSPYPGHFYEVGREAVYLPQQPLIDYNAPVFTSPYHAIAEWIDIRDFHRDQDARVGSVLLFLPECRARFSELTSTPEGFRVSVVRDSADRDLKLIALVHAKDGKQRFSELVTGSPIDVNVLKPIAAVELFLVGPDNTVYDYHNEGQFHSTDHRRLLKGEAADPVPSAISQALEAGESDVLEFKPYVSPGSDKFVELVETVIAFANTKGGRILIGVNDRCMVDGIERDLAKAANGRPLSETLKAYVGELRQKLLGGLNRTVPLTIVEHRIDGSLVLSIDIPEGDAKPYFILTRKIVLIRRGANNVVADPDRDLPAFKGRTDGLAASLVGR